MGVQPAADGKGVVVVLKKRAGKYATSVCSSLPGHKTLGSGPRFLIAMELKLLGSFRKPCLYHVSRNAS